MNKSISQSRRWLSWSGAVMVVAVLLMISTMTLAQSKPAPAKANAAISGAPPVTTTQPSSEEVMKQLLQQRQDNPTIEPSSRPPTEEMATTPLQVDPKVMGVAPGQEAPKLRREGEFVISRRGRAVRAPSSNHLLFMFEADGEKSAEPPMVLMPCQYLQNMEEMIRERGDKVVFVISGQVFSYRGANYILPTMMKLAVDQGNLQK